MTFPIIIYHNPACGTSRNVLAAIRATGNEPTVIEYLKTGWTRPQLDTLLADSGLSPRELLRVNGTDAEARGLTALDVTPEHIINAMLENPLLVNRPIVVTPKGTKLCRPSETVASLL